MGWPFYPPAIPILLHDVYLLVIGVLPEFSPTNCFNYAIIHVNFTHVEEVICFYFRVTASTKMNDISSRSHAILTIHFTQVSLLLAYLAEVVM